VAFARVAVHQTLVTTGSALLFTSLVLGLGFSVFMAAYMVNIAWFGVLMSLAVAVAFLADITLAPALMMLVTRDRQRAHAESD
jgi:predicted RND superfamily exporter protein